MIYFCFFTCFYKTMPFHSWIILYQRDSGTIITFIDDENEFLMQDNVFISIFTD